MSDKELSVYKTCVIYNIVVNPFDVDFTKWCHSVPGRAGQKTALQLSHARDGLLKESRTSELPFHDLRLD
jgi:hypothetical protein